MATFSDIEYAGGASWKFTPLGTSPFDYYLDGKLVRQQSTNDYEIFNSPTGNTTEPPPIEVVDATDTTDPESVQYPPYLTIQWRGTANANYYVVEQYVGSTWTERGRVLESGIGYYQHVTDTLADSTETQWRVTAYDSIDNASQVKAYTITMACNPQPPAIQLSYSSSTGQVTVSAAS